MLENRVLQRLNRAFFLFFTSISIGTLPVWAADNKQRAFMSTLAWSFLQKTIVTSALAPSLGARTNVDGGRRFDPLAKLRDFRGLPKWAVPVLGAAALCVAVLAERRRIG